MEKTGSLMRCSLQQANINAGGVKRFLEEIEKGGYHLHSFMLTRHGKVAYECSWAPYRLDEVHHMHSFTKGLVASAIGILEGEGRISLDDPVVTYFPEYQLNDPTGRVYHMTIRHLLTMSSGHDCEPERHACSDEKLAFLNAPMDYEPGDHFFYTSMGTNMLATIVRVVSGFSLSRFLQLHIFDPLGISGVRFDTCCSGMDQGGGGSFLKTEDMAKITVLFLQKGQWNGRQLIPADWIERMSSVQFRDSNDRSNPDWEDWRQGYGFQVWMCQVPNTFRFDGMYGQFGVVLKDYDASVITTCGEPVTQEVLRLIWKYLVPAIRDGVDEGQQQAEQELEVMKSQLHVDWNMAHEIGEEEQQAGWKRLSGKELRFPANMESMLPAGRVGNCFSTVWAELQRNGIQKLTVRMEQGDCQLDYEDNHNRGTLPVGIEGEPKRGILRSLWGDYETWASGRWNKKGNLEIQVRPVNGEYYQIMELEVSDDQAEVHITDGPWDRRKEYPVGRTYRCRIR